LYGGLIRALTVALTHGAGAGDGSFFHYPNQVKGQIAF
jgi:hypothetical protein